MPFYGIWLYWETIVPHGLLSLGQTMTNDLILGLAFEAEVYQYKFGTNQWQIHDDCLASLMIGALILGDLRQIGTSNQLHQGSCDSSNSRFISKLHCCPCCKLVTVNVVWDCRLQVHKNNIDHKDTRPSGIFRHVQGTRHVLQNGRVKLSYSYSSCIKFVDY